MEEYYEYVKRVTAIHNETVRRLVNSSDTNPVQLMELFEDVANVYLNISEENRSRFFSQEARLNSPAGRLSAEPSSPTVHLAEGISS
jgi:hypothetical protein